jgi:AIR carboxylase
MQYPSAVSSMPSRFTSLGLALQVGIIMGSDSDLPTMRAAAEALRDFSIACEVRVPLLPGPGAVQQLGCHSGRARNLEPSLVDGRRCVLRCLLPAACLRCTPQVHIVRVTSNTLGRHTWADIGIALPLQVTIVSAHRTPQRLEAYARNAAERGLKVRPTCSMRIHAV